MKEHEIIRELECLNVLSSEHIPLQDLAVTWAGRSELLVKAAIDVLGKIRKKIPNVELRTRCNGVSGYGTGRTGIRRECFYVGVNVRPVAMVFCQHGNAADEDGFFTDIRMGYSRGYLPLAGLERDRLLYVEGVLRESYRIITGY